MATPLKGGLATKKKELVLKLEEKIQKKMLPLSSRGGGEG